MHPAVYRYRFAPGTSPHDVEAALVLAILATEALRGESQTRLDAAHHFEPESLSCAIEASTESGRDLNRLFVGFVRREFGEDAFRVERVADCPTSRPRQQEVQA